MNLIRILQIPILGLIFLVLIQLTLVNAQNRIVIVVNDEPITSYDIAQRSRLLQLTTGSSDEEAEELARRELINERLKLKETKRLGISVNPEELDIAYMTIAERTRLSPEELTAALIDSNIDPKTLTDRLSVDIAWSHAVRLRFRQTIRVRDEEVIAALQARGSENTDTKKNTTEYDLIQYIFVIPKDSGEDFKINREKEVKAFRDRFTSCEEGTTFAEGLEEVVVKPLGQKLEHELNPRLVNEIKDIPVNRISRALDTRVGIELFGVCAKTLIDSEAAAIAEKKGEIQNQEGQLMARRYLGELRRTAVIEYR